MVATLRPNVCADRVPEPERPVIPVHAVTLAGPQVPRQAVRDGAVAPLDAGRVLLREPTAVEQVVGAVEEEELSLWRIKPGPGFEVALGSARRAALGKDLQHTVCRVRPVQRRCRAAGDELDPFDVVHRQVRDGAGCCALRPHPRHVHAEGGDGVEVVHAHAVHINHRGAVVAHRRDAACAHDGRSTRLPRRQSDLRRREVGLQQFVQPPGRRRFDLVRSHHVHGGGDPSLRDFTALSGHDHGVQVHGSRGQRRVHGGGLSGYDGDGHDLRGVPDLPEVERACPHGHIR